MKRDGRFIKANGRFIKAVYSNTGRFIKAAMAVLSTGSGQMARSLDLGCGWPISHCPVQAVYQRPILAIFSQGWESKWPFYQGRPAAMAMVSRAMAVLSRPASPSGRFINQAKPVAARPAAVLSTMTVVDFGCGWPISYCPVQAVYQRPGQAIFSKGWESEWPLYQSRSGHGIKADGRSRPASPSGRFINNGRFIKAWLVESQLPFYQARWPLYQGQRPLYQGLIKQQWPLYQS